MYNPNSSPYNSVPPRSYNGVLILILGICGLVVCGLCAPFAWSMGNASLRQMEADGSYDNNERTLVNVGRVLGIIGTVLIILVVVGALLFALMAVGARGLR